MRLKNKALAPFLAVVCICLAACTSEKPVDRSAFKEEMESREIKRVTDAQIMAKGEEIAKTSLQALVQELLTMLKSAPDSVVVTAAYLSSGEHFRKWEDSLQVSILLVPHVPGNVADSLTGLEKDIWEAYQYAPAQATAQVQEYSTTQLIYTQPIFTGSDLGLYLQGQPGGLCGMWRMILPKKTVVHQL